MSWTSCLSHRPYGKLLATFPVGTALGLFWLLAVCHVALTPAAAQTMTRLAPVTIGAADKLLRARVASVPTAPRPKAAQSAVGGPAPRALASGAAAGCTVGSTQPVEIITLASSLKCDLDLIYEYVYNNIEYEPLFGSNKGALGTLLDQRGNDIDHAQLFVALLNASGITQTSYIYGYITVTGTTTPVVPPCGSTYIAPAPGWLGVSNDAVAIVNTISDGGIPSENAVENGADGTLSCLDVAHVWVQVAIAGTNYVFDPSFKQHVVSSGLANLGTVLGYSQSQFLSDAGGTIDSVSISNINRTKVRSDLTTYANNLVAYINANNPASTVGQIIGGKTIIPLTGSPIRQTTLPYLAANQPSGFPQNWGATVPNAYRTCLAISMPGVATQEPCSAATAQTIVLYSDQTYGQRITVFSVPDPSHSGNFIPTLLVNGAAPGSGTNTGPSTASGQPWGIYAAITHPYAGTGANQTKTLSVNAGGSYLVSAGWGRVGRGMVEKHRQLLANALAVPGANPASEPILGESLAVISYNWLAESASQHAIADAIGKTTTQYHHGVGITAQTAIQQTGSQGPYVDLPLNFLTIGQQTCWPNSSCPFPAPIVGSFYTDSGTMSSLESAVLEQTQAPTPNMVAASTVRVVDMNAATGAKTFFADGTTSTGQSNYVNSIRPLLQQAGISYSSSDLAAIDIAVTGASPPPSSPTPTQSQVLAPVDGNVAVGLWKGAAYTVITQTGTSISITQKISGGLDGGYAGTDVPTDDQTSNTNVTIPTPPAAIDVPTVTNAAPAFNNVTVSEPIDAVTGAEIYTNTDLVIGSGSFPYALPFARTYTSSSNLTDAGLGYGWSHSYNLSATVNSDPYEGMGSSSPTRAAAAIAAIYVSQNLLGGSAQSAQSLTLAWMVDRWFTDQITNNTVLISRPNTVEEFVALPQADSRTTTSYSPPLGSAVVLTGMGTGSGVPTAFTYTNKDQTVLNFAPVSGSGASAPISSWITPSGAQVNFSYNGSGNLGRVANNLGRTLTLSYSGTHVSAVSDGSRSVTFGYTGNALTSATDPLSNRTTYAYDAASHLTQIYYPNAPGSAFVTNYYDGLGRVWQQLNANLQPTLFYFAGSRTEIVDAAGDRHVTYQTPRNRIIKDVAVLNGSFGDVFNDTAQQNGLVNVTSTQYDGLDRVILSTAPEGGTVAYGYSPDLESNVITVTKTAKPGSPLSPLTTTYTYDPVWNKPTSITDPLGLVTKLSYASGNLVSVVTDVGGAGHFNAATRFSYNAVGQVLTILDPVQTQTQFAYDSFGNRVSVVRDCCGAGHLNQTTTLAYSALGDVVSSTDPNGNVTTSTFDADRRRLTTTSPATAAAPGGVVTAFAYDPVGQLLRTSQSTGGATLRQVSTSYTPTGKIATTTDANGNVTQNAYDPVDRLASTTDPVGRKLTFAYDALSRRLSVSNAAIQGSPLLQQAYTPDGLVASLTNANGFATSFAPDGFDRLSTTTYPDASTEVLGYDADGNILSRQTRAGATISFTYDTLNRLATKAAPSEPTVTYSHDLVGHLLGAADTSAAIVAPSTVGTIASMAFTYDSLNNLTGSSWSPVVAQAATTATNATFAFAYDGTNRRISQTTTDNGYWYYPAATASTVAYTANNLDQYTAIGAIAPTYDANGNLTFDGTFTYGYDAENRLISASGAGNTASYSYDAQGRRKTKTVNGTTTVLVQDPQGRAVMDYDGSSGAIQSWYAFGVGPNDVLNQVNVAGSTRATYIPDVQGSIIASLDAASGTLTRAGYLAYGESGTTAGTFRYTGARIDAETNGLYDYRARVYSPALGRFLQADPIGSAGGINLYVYVGNDPLNWTDPFGLTPDSPKGAVVSDASPDPVQAGDQFAQAGGATSAYLLPQNILFPCLVSTEGCAGTGGGGRGTSSSAAEAEVSGTALARSLGQAGENAVGTTGPKVSIEIPGSGQVRVPDALTQSTLTEVKNVGSLSYTQQLRDFTTYSQMNGLNFDLYVRPSTQLSGPLQQAIAGGQITLKLIPGTP
ncbi:MAG: RHS repeat-associated core domain-containing protein [Xanthobacteraceae bacterium]|nr:RHS repeat-associated core domain-containing protein [Xanthobacteraceae bacterium]